jgi:4'-phosphopantetheinyl transferase
VSADQGWTAPSAEVRLDDEGVVDVWRADLAADAGEGLAMLLAPDERERAARFAQPDDGRRWARGRGILRALLGRYLDADPAALRFVEGEHGKPALAGEGAGAVAAGGAPMELNLSHSGDVALYAFARGRAVGVDVELARRPVDAVAIARRVLGAETAAALAAIENGEERDRAFLCAWSRHEAALKCRGTGIGAAAAGIAPQEGLWIVELDVGLDGAAALAVDGPPCELRRFAWEG